MKTPMQELIELITLKENKEDGRVFLMPYITIAKLEAMLGKEKEVIMNAYIEAGANLSDIIKEAAEQYYNETFSAKEK